MFYSRISGLLLTGLFSVLGFSQSNFESLGETGLSLNYELSNNLKLNSSVRSRYFLYRDSDFKLTNRQIDLVQFISYNVDYNNSIGFGVQYRFREAFDGNSNELRLTQQYNFRKRQRALRFGHRVRLEQRILDDFTIIRSRYRFAIDFPLNGEKVDVGEAYMVMSTEALLSVSNATKPEFDHRTTAQIGWQVSEDLKLQAGLEYRFEAFNIETEQLLFVLTTAILKL